MAVQNTLDQEARDNPIRPLHISVIAGPHRDFDLSPELTLLKAALLYGDKVTLCSLTSSTAVLMSQLRLLPNHVVLDSMTHVADKHAKMGIKAARKLLQRKKAGKRLNEADLKRLALIEGQLSAAKEQMATRLDKMIGDAGGDALAAALDSGLVQLHWLDISGKGAAVQGFVNAVLQTIDSGDTYPLLDDSTSSFVDAAVREGKFIPLGSTVRRAKQVGLTSELFRKLPVFEAATIDEVLGIRQELHRPLVRFRAAMSAFSRDIASAAWDADFPHDAEGVYIEKIEPAVLEIEEARKSGEFLRILGGKLLTESPTLPMAGVMGLLLGQTGQLPDVLAHGVAGTAAVTRILAKSVQEWRQTRRQIEGNQLYFYYRLGKVL